MGGGLSPGKSKHKVCSISSSIAQSGFVHVVKAEWNKSYYDDFLIF